MSKHILKRKALKECSNGPLQQSKQSEYKNNFCTDDFLPVSNTSICDEDKSDKEFTRNYQNVHPVLAWYKHDLPTSHLSYEKKLELTHPDNEKMLYAFLTEVCLIPSSRQCQFCGNSMRIVKDKSLFWICTRTTSPI